MKWWWIAGGAIATIIIGGVLGGFVTLRSTETAGPADPIIREVLLGVPAEKPTVEKPWQGSDRLTQKRTYATNDTLAVRLVSDEPIERILQFSVRLLREDGSVKTLSPSTFTVPGGVGGYCCWQVDTPGTYSMQIFRERQTPFVIPLTVVKSQQGNKSPLQL